MAINVTKPTVGGSEDTWGATINTALDTIVDAANGTSGTLAPDLSTLTINGTDVTATAAELNALDGITASTAELNTLGGLTASTAELNVLDGVTATTTEINYIDGVTSSVQAQIDAVAAAVAAASSAATPAGTVIQVAQNSAPTGYLKANGAAVSRTTYADLFAAIGTTFGAGNGSTTFELPDLRGEFVRGWDDSRGVDSGRSFGSSQTDAFQGHYHKLTSEDGTQLDIGNNVNMGSGGSGRDVNAGTVDAVREALTDGTNGTPRTAAETRPRNIALLYCIKT